MNILKVYKKIVDFTSDVIYIFAILYALVYAPMLLGHHPIVVVSESMNPYFKVGGIVYYSHVQEDQLQKDDVITFSYEDDDKELITHRIYAIENGKITTKGDGNEKADSKQIEYSNVKGRVSNVMIPFLGYFVGYVNNNMYVIVCAILILISEFILDNLRCFKRR